MSKLKLPMLYFAPLCLKIHGRIVGAVSRMSIVIYIAFGLLILSSALLMMILAASNKNEQNIEARPEQKVESQVAETVEAQPTVRAVTPQTAPELTAKVINKDESNDIVTISKSLRGPIQLDFGWQFHQVYNDWRYHTGIDISGPNGQSVEAIYNGQVFDIFRDRHTGLTVVVKNNTYSVYYGSLSEVTVSKGNSIRAGQTIGTMGSCDGEPYHHLHLAIKKGESYIDPKLVINKE